MGITEIKKDTSTGEYMGLLVSMLALRQRDKIAKMEDKRIRDVSKAMGEQRFDRLQLDWLKTQMREKDIAHKNQTDFMNTQLRGLGVELQNTKFEHQLMMDKNTMLFNLFLGDASEDIKTALGDEKFADTQARAIGELAGEKLRATPHDAGVFTVLKKPREALSFEKALRYWRGKNIDDVLMWADWGDELAELGYTFDASKNKIVGGTSKTPTDLSDPNSLANLLKE